MSTDRYLTDEAVTAAAGATRCFWSPPAQNHPYHEVCRLRDLCHDNARNILEAALPELLRRAADEVQAAEDAVIGGGVVALRQRADELEKSYDDDGDGRPG